MEVRCDRSAPGAVREALSQVEGVGWLMGDAMLVASELVTNAVRHSGAGADDLIEVRVERTRTGLVISVLDPGYSGGAAAVAPEDLATIGGLGLRVVEGIARRWGARRERGYLVWAELPTSEADLV
jgi:serine/threonine-protein kinase RsbW